MATGDDSRKERCGFVGLGHLGGPIARRITDGGFPLLLWDLDPRRFDAFADTPARVAEGVADLGARSEHVGVCVVDDADVRAVAAALIPAMQAGSRIAIHSTISPETCREVAEHAATRGVEVLDAPTTGIDKAASAGELTVMIGGDAGVVAAARPVFETFGRLILHLGGLGAGMNAKLVHNGLVAANLSLAYAALEAGTALSVDRDALIQILMSSTAKSYGVELASQLSQPGDFGAGAKLLLKDVGLLADSLKGNAAAGQMRDAALPFLRRARRDKDKPS